MKAFSGASRRNNETEPKEHKTCALSHTRLWEAVLGFVGWEPHLVKMSAVPEATLSFNVISIKIMVAELRNRKKKNITSILLNK